MQRFAKVWAAINKDDENQRSGLHWQSLGLRILCGVLWLVASARILVTGRANRNQLSFEAPKVVAQQTDGASNAIQHFEQDFGQRATHGITWPIAILCLRLLCTLAGRNEGNSFFSCQLIVKPRCTDCLSSLRQLRHVAASNWK